MTRTSLGFWADPDSRWLQKFERLCTVDRSFSAAVRDAIKMYVTVTEALARSDVECATERDKRMYVSRAIGEFESED